jgi:hypothetical protein
MAKCDRIDPSREDAWSQPDLHWLWGRADICTHLQVDTISVMTYVRTLLVLTLLYIYIPISVVRFCNTRALAVPYAV